MTIYDIAEKAGVSIATISRAMNPETRSKVAPETLEMIEALVKKHGYAPNFAAKNLNRTSFKNIGILLPHHAGIFLEPYYSKILAGMADSLLDTEFDLKIVMLKCRPEKWDKHNFKFGEGVDGLVVTHWHAFFSHPSAFEKLNVPCTVISDPEKKTRVHFVSGDHFSGGRKAAEYLYSLGHRKIAVLTGPHDSSDGALRLRGFQAFLAEKGIALNPELIAQADFQEQTAYEKFGEMLRNRKDFTAVFCCNDNMAFGVLRQLSERGIECPKEISVMGYDNEPRGQVSSPALTSIEVPLYEMAKEAGRRLLGYLKDRKAQSFFYQETLYPVCLIERKSTARKA